MNELDHEQLDVSVAAIDVVAWADEVVERLPRGRASLADQLQRAATSMALNIAEGAEEFPDQRHGALLSKRHSARQQNPPPSSTSATVSRWSIPPAITPAVSAAASRGDACPDGPANGGHGHGHEMRGCFRSHLPGLNPPPFRR
jgi:hypothetical protein